MKYILILILFTIPSRAFTQSITLRLVDYKSYESIGGALIYVNDSVYQTDYTKLWEGQIFSMTIPGNFKSIEISYIGYAPIVLVGFDNQSTLNYDLGTLYLAPNPYDNIYHIAYKNKVGVFFSFLTESRKVKRIRSREIKLINEALENKYKYDGKSESFLYKYDGNTQYISVSELEH